MNTLLFIKFGKDFFLQSLNSLKKYNSWRNFFVGVKYSGVSGMHLNTNTNESVIKMPTTHKQMEEEKPFSPEVPKG